MAAPYFLQRFGTGFKYIRAVLVGGVGSANSVPALNAAGVFDISMFPANIGQDVAMYPASENITSGSQVNLYNNGGVLTARNADATAQDGGKKSDGFAIAGVSQGQNVLVYRNGGLNTGVSGLTPGVDYFLGTAGGVTPTQNTTSGQTDQYIGKAAAAGVLDQLPPQTFVAVY